MMYQHALYIHPVQAGLAHNDDAYLATAYILTDTKTMFLKNLEATLHSDATTMLDNILQRRKLRFPLQARLSKLRFRQRNQWHQASLYP